MPSGLEALVPPLSDPGAGADRGWCLEASQVSDPGQCVHGATDADSSVVLFGDFRAEQWFPAFEALAASRGQRLVSLTRIHCPSVSVPVIPPQASEPDPDCGAWRQAAFARIREEKPVLVVLANRGTYPMVVDGATVQPGTPEMEAAWSEGLGTTIAALAGAPVAVMGETPVMGDVPACLAANPHDFGACAAGVAAAVPAHRHDLEAAAAEASGATFIDPTPWLCDDSVCPAVLGDYLVYRDAVSRLGAPFAASLESRLATAFPDDAASPAP